MLGKLMKYDLRWSARFLIPLYIILVFLTIVGRIAMGSSFLWSGGMGVIAGILLFCYIITIIVISIATFIIVIYCFYKNLLTDEGYLMFTLPVKTSKLILSKALVASFWNVLSIIILGSSIILILTGNPIIKKEITEEFHLMYDSFNFFFSGINGVIMIIEVVLVVIIGIAYNVGYTYISIAVGQLISRNKILGSVAAYVVLGTVLQVAVIIVAFIFMFIFDPNYETLDMNIFLLTYSIGLALAGVTTGLYFFFTTRILSRKLNLE